MKRVILLLIGFALVFCWSPAGYSQSPSGEVVIGLASLYDQTFHPTGSTQYRKHYLEPMYDYIVGVDKNGKFDPDHGVASKWEQSSDLRSWTFWIKDGIKFHNGDPLTNEDVAYTLNIAPTKENRAWNRTLFRQKVDRAEAVPPNKVVLHLKRPWPTCLYFMSSLGGIESMVIPKKYLEEKGPDYFNKHPVGSGPYKFSEWKENVHIKLVAQDSHWRVGVPKFRYMTFKLMPEAGTREAALQAGEVDIIPVGVDRSVKLKKDGFTINKNEDALFVALMWLGDRFPEYPIHKLKVRQALIYAINKKQILDQILMGQGTLKGCTTPMFSWAIEYKDYAPTPYDPKMAKKLLAEAGYPKGFTMYFFSFTSKLPEQKLINEAIAGFWEAIGVKVKILEMEYSGFRPYWTNSKKLPGPGAIVFPWTNRPVFSYPGHYHSSARYSHKRDPELDRRIEVFQDEATMEGYVTSARKVVDYILEKYYSSGMFSTHMLFALSKKVPVWKIGIGIDGHRWEYIGVKE
jgi:peptide/nickel transport system substrate-binding protein